MWKVELHSNSYFPLLSASWRTASCHMNRFVYAIYNKKYNKIYIGQTNNLERRLNEHNSKFGNHYTAKVGGDWEIVYQEKVLTKEEVLKREKQLKSYQGRKFIKTFIPL